MHPYFTATLKEQKQEDKENLPDTGEENIVTHRCIDSDLPRSPAKGNVFMDQEDSQNAIVPIVTEQDDVIVSKQKDDVTLELGDNVVIQLICEPDDDFLAPFVFEQEEDIEDLPVTGKEDIVTHRQVDSTQSRNPAKGNFVTAHNDEAEFMDVDGLEDIISAMVIIFVCKTLTHFYFKCFYAFIETSCLPKIHAGFKIISFLLFL